MADVKISGLPASTVPLAGTEVLPIVQGGATKQVSVANLTAGRNVAAADLTTTGNTILGNASTDTLNVGNGDLIKDASGNVGVAKTPNAWMTANAVKALQFNAGAIWSYSNSEFAMGQNYYYNSAGQSVYIDSVPATEYYQYIGTHAWRTAPSGTAGNAITFTQAMLLDANSNLNVTGTISPQQATTASAPAYVKGAIYFDTTLNKLRVGGATAWETITSV